MPQSLPARRVLSESVPLAAVVLLWTVVAWIDTTGAFAGTIRAAGVVMGALYALVRGLALGRSLDSTVSFDDIEATLRANLGALLPAGAWFLLAALAQPLRVVLGALENAGVPRLLLPSVDGVTFVLSTTGLLTVALYAVAVGYPLVAARTSSDERSGA